MTKNLESKMGFIMKQELAEAVRDSLKGKINLLDANTAVSAVFSTMRNALLHGKRVNIINVGVLYPSSKNEYKLRLCGNEMLIPASRTIRFRQSKSLKDILKKEDYGTEQ